MSNGNLAIDTDKIPQPQKNYVIDNDKEAEKKLYHITKLKEDRDRRINLCEQMIDEYKQQIEAIKDEYDINTSFVRSKLIEYFQTVPHRKAKTQEKYQLGLGTLILKHKKPKTTIDDEKFIEWLENSGNDDFVETKKKAKWGDFKKTCTITDKQVISEDGEEVEGIKVTPRPDEFEIVSKDGGKL